MSQLVLRNRQRVRCVNILLLRRIMRTLLEEFMGVKEYELCLHLIAESEMTRLNEQFLDHKGSTDVITFDHLMSVGDDIRSLNKNKTKSPHADSCRSINGEIFVCVNQAISQARHFRTTWQSEIVRYIVHGILHLLGHDDLKPAPRRKMKREENRLLRRLIKQFPLARLAR